MRIAAPLFALSLLLPACAHRTPYAAAQSDLALQRVVLYRNGIGYFERHGKVEGDALNIKVRRDQVDDLLKSLTVVERASGKAVSVSMPLDPESWASAALATLAPGSGSLADVLDGLRGTEVVVRTTEGRIRGRIVMVEQIVNEPDPRGRAASRGGMPEPETPAQIDHKLTLMQGDGLEVVRLSKVLGITLKDGDLALQLHRRLDASAGEGMFQQIEIVIRLAGARKHDLVVSYVVEAPMWKPTYRVVLPEKGKGKALLQGWAVVDNTSGEDWHAVDLALTSGEPIAFRYDLHTPRTIDRADLTEAGVAKRARVAVGETTFEESEPAADAPAPPASAAETPKDVDSGEYYAEDERGVAKEKKADKARRTKAGASKPAPGAGGGVGRAAERFDSDDAADGDTRRESGPAVDYDALRRSTLASARAKQVSGMSAYDLDDRVTVPNGTSTMVAILNAQVEAEQTFLYRPGGAGMGYEANPYRVVRFKNSTPFVLEPGPISIYSGDSFVGEGLSEAVGANTSATLPFAVEPAIMVTSATQWSGEEMKLLKIVRGVLECETFSRTTTTWSVKGQPSLGAFTVLVRHPKAGWNYQLVERPKGTEDLVDAYLIPIAAGKNGEATITVSEQTPSTTSISIWDTRAIALLETLLAQTTLTPELRKQLQPIVDLRQQIGRIDTEIEGLKRQQVELDQRAQETRANLEAIKKDPAAGSLRSKLSRRLEEFTSDGDKLGRKVVELQSQRLEKKIALEDLLQNLEVAAPPSKSAK
jgi:hypothetical protein